MANFLNPWIAFKTSYTKAIASDATAVIQQNQNLMIVDSFNLSNTTQYSLEVDVNFLRPYILSHINASQQEVNREIQYDNPYVTRNLSLNAYGREQLLKEDCLYLEPGDYLTAQSDFFKNQLDSLIGYRQITPSSSTAVSVNSLTASKDSTTGLMTVTGTTANPLTLTTGSPVLITGSTPQGYNGVYLITVSGSSSASFSYSLNLVNSSALNPSTPITGTISLLPLTLNVVQTTS